MEERIIEFKTAQLAKEKKFKEKTLYYYYYNKDKIENAELIANSKSKIINKTAGDAGFCGCDTGDYLYSNTELEELYINVNKYPAEKNMFQAPTQAQLQTWLRNKKILIEVRPVDDWNSWCYSIFMEDCMSPFFEVKNNNEYPSYEDALETGLYEGLTNIK